MSSCTIGGVRFDNVNMSETVAQIVRLAQKSSKPALICTANMDHLARLNHDEEFRRVYASADLVVADGMPIVWLSRLAGAPLKERVAGSDLFLKLAEASHQTGLSLFFLGGQPGSTERAAGILRGQYPNVQIAGCYCPPMETFGTPEEEARILRLIQDAKPDILLVGLGSPKQEKWIARHKAQLGVPVSIGVGASFDMAAGKVQRAPRWAQRTGMEWLCRLVQEPKRLWSRYVGRDLPYLLALTLSVLRQRGRLGESASEQADEGIRHAA